MERHVPSVAKIITLQRIAQIYLAASTVVNLTLLIPVLAENGNKKKKL